MAKFITGVELEEAIYDIIWNAEETLLIVSPFIRLDDYFKTLFKKHLNNPNLHIVIVFGKNENDVKRSLSKSDFDYFKSFMNISVVYVPNLHAKYYGNEHKGVITSINLYDFSFKNNIEFGVYSEYNIVLNSFVNNTDTAAWDTCFKIAEDNESVFIKRPVFEKKMFSVLRGKSYIKSDILHDVTNKFYSYSNLSQKGGAIKKLTDFPEELELGSQSSDRPTRAEVENMSSGFCIRSGEKIAYNTKRPYSEKSFKSWIIYANMDYPEKYCHKTGKESKGKTSMRNPVL